MKFLLPGKFRRTSLGLEINDRKIRIAEVADRGGKPYVSRYLSLEVEQDWVDHGRIANPKQLGLKLKEELGQYGITGKHVHIAIPNQFAMVRVLRLPNVSPKQLKKIIDFEVRNHMSLPFDPATYAYMKLNGTPVGDREGLCDVLFVASPLDVIQEFAQTAKMAGLVPKSIEIRALSLMRLLRQNPELDSGKAWVVADLQNSNSNISVFYQGGLRVTFNLRQIWEAPPQAMREAAASGEETVPPHNEPFKGFGNACEELVDEIERLMSFFRYHLNYRHVSFSSIVLSGDLPYIRDVMNYLQSKFEATLSIIDPGGLQSDIPVSAATFSSFAVSVGLALRGREI